MPVALTRDEIVASRGVESAVRAPGWGRMLPGLDAANCYPTLSLRVELAPAKCFWTDPQAI